MTIRETLIAAITGLSLLATPAISGGPVIIEDEYDVTEPSGHSLRDAVPLIIIGGLILCAIACGGSDDAPVAQPPKGPGPVCKEGC